mgnify:CR=1 FL=1
MQKLLALHTCETFLHKTLSFNFREAEWTITEIDCYSP